MPATIADVARMLEEEGVRYEPRDETSLLTAFETERYRSPSDDPGLVVAVELLEDGEYLKVYAPQAFAGGGPHTDAFLRACAMVQWRTKLVQFEFDERDGEVRPIVEFPLEDATLTRRQLMRCVVGLVGILDRFYPALKRALEEGVVHFEDDEEPGVADMLGTFLSGFPPEVLADALRVADERRRAGEAEAGESADERHPEDDEDFGGDGEV